MDTAATERSDFLQKSTVSNLAQLVQGQSPTTALPEQSITLVDDSNISSELITSYMISRQSYRLQHLREHFPTIPAETIQNIFPLLDPLDLDLIVSWSIPSTSRRGHTILHSTRVAPEFSIVEGVRREVDAAIVSGGKKTRTMYEETGRLRRVLMDSVLNGVLAREEDPVVVKIAVGLKRRKGLLEHDFAKG